MGRGRAQPSSVWEGVSSARIKCRSLFKGRGVGQEGELSLFAGCELNGSVREKGAHVCDGACVVEHVACTPAVPPCVSVSGCVAMCVLLCVPGCVCLGGCLWVFVLRDVAGLRLCECLSGAACVWQHVGLWTGLA